jgi:lysophospholipase L1-like esterase
VDNRKYFWSQREKDQNGVVFVGDSLTGNWKDLAKAFPDLKVVNRGIGGDTSRGVLFRFKEDVLDLNPKAIVVTVGTNDLTAMGKPADAAGNVEEMLKQIDKANPALPVVVCTTPPSDSPKAPVKLDQRQALNAEIKKVASAHPNVIVCDIYPVFLNADGSLNAESFTADRLHLGPAGYEKWSAVLKPIFAKLDFKK